MLGLILSLDNAIFNTNSEYGLLTQRGQSGLGIFRAEVSGAGKYL